jgi:hypothetical protein
MAAVLTKRARDVTNCNNVTNSSRSDDVMALAQQHEEAGGVGGAVAVVKRVARASAKQQAAAAAGKHQQQLQQRSMQWQLPVDAAWPDQCSSYAAAAAAAAALDATTAQAAAPAPAAAAAVLPGSCGSSKATTNGLQLLSGSVLLSADWSPALQQQLGSPTSNTSSHSRLLVGGSSSSAPGSTPSSGSPACGAAATAAAAAAGGVNSKDDVNASLHGSAAVAVCPKLEVPPAAAVAHAAQAAQPEQHWQQQLQQGVVGSMLPSATTTAIPAPAAAAQRSPSMSAAADNRLQQSLCPDAAYGDAAAAGVGGGADGWPQLPDADNLLVVGKALVQVGAVLALVLCGCLTLWLLVVLNNDKCLQLCLYAGGCWSYPSAVRLLDTVAIHPFRRRGMSATIFLQVVLGLLGALLLCCCWTSSVSQAFQFSMLTSVCYSVFCLHLQVINLLGAGSAARLLHSVPRAFQTISTSVC